MSLKRAAPIGAPQSSQGPSLPEGQSIFLVDEDDAVREAVAMSLRAAGHTVAAFGSGRQFLDAYQPGSSGCLVADMDLSDLGAMELLHALAASHAAALPAIITSRHLKRRAPAGGLPPGRILFLDKPFGIDELLRLIQIALAGAPGDRPGS